MGRIDPPGGRPGSGKVVPGKSLFGIAAVLVIAVSAYELGKRSAAPPSPAPVSPVPATPPATAPPREPADASAPASQSVDNALAAFERARSSPREERSVMEVTVPRPEPAPPTQPLPETPHDKMTRCLSFAVESDEIHYGGYSPVLSPVKVTASNGCSFSFEGPDVSVEVQAIPLHGEGTIASAVGQFRDPIPSRGSSQTQLVLSCPRCDEVTHRFEVHLLP